jgi:hypothetical protein
VARRGPLLGPGRIETRGAVWAPPCPPAGGGGAATASRGQQARDGHYGNAPQPFQPP